VLLLAQGVSVEQIGRRFGKHPSTISYWMNKFGLVAPNRSDGVSDHRRRLKSILVAEAGGGCCICGYDKHITALEFHHIDPSRKVLAISQNGVTLSLDALRAEAEKCVLVCSNCHAELEAGVLEVPASLRHGAERRRPRSAK
jgi:hypothetical protein